MAGFLIRWLLAGALVAATWNPTDWHFVRWVETHRTFGWLPVLVGGAVLAVGYVVFGRLTWRSIGIFGALLTLTLCGTVLWVAYEWGWLALDGRATLGWLAIGCVSLVLAIGASWPVLPDRLPGEVDPDDPGA